MDMIQHEKETLELCGFTEEVKATPEFQAGKAAHAAIADSLDLSGDIRPITAAVQECEKLGFSIHNGMATICYFQPSNEEERRWYCGFESAGGEFNFPHPLYNGGNSAEPCPELLAILNA